MTDVKTFRPFTEYTGDVKERISKLALGDKGLTAIVGEEASYKSSIGIGMRLSLRGEYEPIGKHASDLLSLAADRDLGIEVSLSGPDGSASWRLKVDPDTGKAKRPEAPHFEGPIASLTEDQRYCIIPSDGVRDLLRNAKGEKKLREAFLRRFGGESTHIPTPLALDEAEEKAWAEAVRKLTTEAGEGASVDTILAGLSEYFRLESGRVRREITPVEKNIAQRKAWLAQQEMAGGVSPELLDSTEAKLKKAQAYEDAQALRDEYAEVTQRIAALEKEMSEEQEAHTKSLEEVRRRLDECRHAVLTMQTEYAECKEALAKAAEGATTNRVLAEAYQRAIDAHKTNCQFCPHDFGSVEPLQATRDLFLARFESRRGQHAQEEARALAAEQALAAAEQQLRSVEFELQRTELTYTLKRDGQNVILRELRCDEADLKKTLTPALETYKGPSVEELTKKVAILREAVQARSTLSRESTLLRGKEKEYEVLKKLEGEATQLQKLTMERIARVASEEVSRGMLDGRSARFDPETYSWYVTRPDGQEFGPFGALCGTERTSLLLGYMAAWTRGSPLRVAILDDEDMVGLSTKGLRDFRRQCEALRMSGDFTQVVLVSNRPELWLNEDGQLLPECSNWTVILRRPVATTSST